MNLRLNKKLLLTSIPLAYVFVKISENFVRYCPKPREGIIANDAIQCEIGFPLPHAYTGGFTGGETIWPILLINLTIVTAVIYIIFNYSYKKIKKK